jgi:parallel beta-helix repeat protein
LQRFLDREKKLNRADLILPIYFVDTPLINEDELRAEDELAQAIASRQYADWRELRFEPFTNPQVGKTLERLARQIRDALPRAPKPQKAAAPAKPPAETQPATPSAAEAGEQTAQRPTTKNEPPPCVVDQLHRGDFTTITEAIEKSAPGTRIVVRPGLYQEGIVINKPLEIVGDGAPGEVVIQSSGKHVILFQTAMGRVANLTLRQTGGGSWYGVDISQGRLVVEDCDITSQSYACVAIHNGADPILRRNRIHDGKQNGVFVYENGQGTLEDNDIFGNTLSGVESTTGGNPTLRGNRIHDGKEGGVLVDENGQGLLEDNDIFGNTIGGVEIKTGGNPTLRRNRIHDGRQSGVLVDENGQGLLEDNDIFGNAYCGVEIRAGGSPTLRHNRINKNSYQAIWVREGSGGIFEDNDLRDNAEGAWNIATDSREKVKRSNNQE